MTVWVLNKKYENKIISCGKLFKKYFEYQNFIIKKARVQIKNTSF